MAIKYLDIQYLRAQSVSQGQVVVVGTSYSITTDGNLIISNGNIGIGTSTPSQKLSVGGNILLYSANSQIIFSDGTVQSTAAATATIGGTTGSVQFNSSGELNGNNKLFWDNANYRLGINNNVPNSSLQIKDVGYESTNTTVSDTTTTVLDSFPVPNYRSCHYIIQVTDTNNSWFHTSQLMMIQDGMVVDKSEYNVVYTHARLGEFDCQILSGNVELLFTPSYISNKNIKVIRTSIEP